MEAAAAGPPQAVWRTPVSWPAVAIPSRERASEFLPYVRLALRAAAAAVLVAMVAVLLLILLYRWVDPPTSTLMVGQRLTGTSIQQCGCRWSASRPT